ncbi:MAG: ABC transporter permease [Dehalococcoidia bacterium]
MSVALPGLGMRLPNVSYRAYRVWQRNRDVYLRLWRAEAIWPLAEPLITLLALGLGLGDLISRAELPGGQRYIEFIAPGILAVFPMWAAAGECGWGSFFRMENQRTYHAIIATPVSIEDVITGEILWGATRGFISSVYILAVSAAFLLLHSPLALLVPVMAYISSLMFASISLSYTSIARSISSLNYFFALFVTPQFWLGGVFFPLENLPEELQTAAWFVPATHVVEIYRGLVEGSLNLGHLGDLAWIAVVAAVFYYLALISMRRRLIQ